MITQPILGDINICNFNLSADYKNFNNQDIYRTTIYAYSTTSYSCKEVISSKYNYVKIQWGIN